MHQLAVFGGTFNPIHLGHIRLCCACHEACGFDQVLLIPSCVPPHKQVPGLLAAEHRLEMCRLAAKAYPFLEVSDIEIRRKGTSYTIDTLQELTQEFPNSEISLIIGSDMLYMLDKWYGYQEILTNYQIVTGARYQNEYQKLLDYQVSLGEQGNSIRIVRFPSFVISSTQIRKLLHDGKEGSRYLDASVWSYIRQHRLYVTS